MTVKEALGSEGPQEGVKVHGWVRTLRDSKEFSFVELNDGTCLGSLRDPARDDRSAGG